MKTYLIRTAESQVLCAEAVEFNDGPFVIRWYLDGTFRTTWYNRMGDFLGAYSRQYTCLPQNGHELRTVTAQRDDAIRGMHTANQKRDALQVELDRAKRDKDELFEKCLELIEQSDGQSVSYIELETKVVKQGDDLCRARCERDAAQQQLWELKQKLKELS